MALITTPTQLIPDLQHEYHTVTIDSIGQTTANTFTCHLQQPLKNVVQAKLLAARINTTTATKHCYLSIEELDSFSRSVLLTNQMVKRLKVLFVILSLVLLVKVLRHFFTKITIH